MLNTLTVAVAKELHESSKMDYEEAYGRFFTRLILSCPVALNLEEAGSVIASVLADVSAANQMTGYFEAISLWQEELQKIPGLVEKLGVINAKAEMTITKSESLLFRLIDGLKLTDNDRNVILERLTTFKEASKKLGYSEVAQMFATSQNS